MTVPSERSDRTSPDRENIRYGVRIPYTGSNRETRHVSRDTSSTGHRWYGVITDGVDNGRYKREREVFTCTAAATIPGPGSICRVRLRSSRRSPKVRRFAVPSDAFAVGSGQRRAGVHAQRSRHPHVRLFHVHDHGRLPDRNRDEDPQDRSVSNGRRRPAKAVRPSLTVFFFFSARTYRSTASPRSSTTSVTSRSISTQISFFRSVFTRRCRLLAPPRVYIWSDMNRVQTARGGFFVSHRRLPFRPSRQYYRNVFTVRHVAWCARLNVTHTIVLRRTGSFAKRTIFFFIYTYLCKK